MKLSDEPRAVAERYARRADGDRYSLARPEVLLALQERQRATRVLLDRAGFTDYANLRVLEVGCGSGGNLLELLRLGFRPEHLVGIELLPERAARARQVLPAVLTVHTGDALEFDCADGSQDMVVVSTVFSSLLDDDFPQRLAAAIWRWLRPGGAVLWYDFTFDNPANRDVRGLPPARVRALFPRARITSRRVTLAPPIARRLCRVHPALYALFDIPLLRTHLLAWISKPKP